MDKTRTSFVSYAVYYAVHMGSMSSSDLGSTVTLEELGTWLSTHGKIDTAEYGKGAAKSLQLLLDEVKEGETILTLDPQNNVPVRLVAVVNVMLKNDNGQTLIEAFQGLPTGVVRERGLPLSEKMLPNENWKEAAVRAVMEELGPVLKDNALIQVDEDSYELLEEEKQSQSYPGLFSRYSCHRVNVSVEGLPQGDFETEEERSDGRLKHYWKWRE